MIAPRVYTLKTGEAMLARTAEPADAADTRAIVLRSMVEGAYGPTEPDEFDVTVEQEEQWLRKHADDPRSLALVAEVDGQVVALVNFETPLRRRMAHSGTLGIAVDTEWRERGVGVALMSALLDWAEAHPEIEIVRLGVLSTNSRAIHVYRKLGFIEEGRRQRAFKMAPGMVPGQYVDDIWMCRPVKSEGSVSAPESAREVADRWMARVWVERDVAAIDDLHAPDFVDRSPAGRGSDLEAYKAGIAELYAAFPDWRAMTEDLVVDDARGEVAIRWTATGTHTGPFLGFAPTGRRVVFSGIEIVRVVDGRIAERWGEWDGLALQDQLRG